MYSLTRFLYIKDEVELSLVTSLLKKQNLQECYYWTFELYYSGFDNEVVQLLWKIYFDFYYELNPCMEDYMLKKHSLWNVDKNMIHIASIVRNLFRLKSSPNAFILRQYTNDNSSNNNNNNNIAPTIIYKTKTKIKWLSSYESKFHNLLLSMKHGHTANICYYIKLLIDSGEVSDIRDVIMNFIKPTIIQFDLDGVAFERKWNSRLYKNDLHYLLAFIAHLQTPVSILNKCNVFVTPKEEDIDFINKVENEPIPTIKKGEIVLDQIYNTLSFKRYFKISETIGAFKKLSRWTISNSSADFLKQNWFHWEYYAANGCPLWFSRVEKFGGSFDHDKKEIVFPSDVNKERFYDLYAYEFDEQPRYIWTMSHSNLVERKWQEWYYDLFPEESMVNVCLEDDFEFVNY